MACPTRLLLSVILVALSGGSAAAVVERPLEDGTTALATFSRGHTAKPAVVVLHGFLQTRHFATVHNLTTALAGEGHTVLAPTLSLGIDRRRQSLACDAVHNHHLEQGVAEVAGWVRWLAERSAGPIVLVGHSTGGLSLLSYLEGDPHPRVSKLVAASLGTFSSWSPPLRAWEQEAKARKQAEAGRSDLDRYSIGYCAGNYVAPPAAFLSYIRWQDDQVLASIGRSPVPVEVILGSDDSHLPANWPQRLAEAGAEVRTIAGAGHFFGDLHEFAFHDMVRRCLARTGGH
jgi:pimeloyl-ACP methyl ester carboxylesterase